MTIERREPQPDEREAEFRRLEIELDGFIMRERNRQVREQNKYQPDSFLLAKHHDDPNYFFTEDGQKFERQLVEQLLEKHGINMSRIQPGIGTETHPLEFRQLPSNQIAPDLTIYAIKGAQAVYDADAPNNKRFDQIESYRFSIH